LVRYYYPGHRTDEAHLHQIQTNKGVQRGQWITQEFDFRAPKTDWRQTIPMPRKTAQANYQNYSWPSDVLNTNAPESDRGGQAGMARHLKRVNMRRKSGQRVYQAKGLTEHDMGGQA
jgi:uncharacterized protein involved in type VI secretion and phage assembly